MSSPLPKDTLTPRERQTVELVAQGYSTADIAAQLGCTTHAVRNYIWRASEKIGASNRVEIALFMLGTVNRLEFRLTPLGPRAAIRERKALVRGAFAVKKSA